MNGYEELAAGIIYQAVVDYYNITKRYRKDKKRLSKWSKKELNRTVKFFRSQWYDELAFLCRFRISGEELMKILNKKIDEGTPIQIRELVV